MVGDDGALRPSRYFSQGHRFRLGAKPFQSLAQVGDHGVGAAEVEVLGDVGDVSLEEGLVDPLVEDVLGARASSVTVQEVTRGPRMASNSSRRMMSRGVAVGGDEPVAGEFVLLGEVAEDGDERRDPGAAGDEGARAAIGDGAPAVAQDQLLAGLVAEQAARSCRRRRC